MREDTQASQDPPLIRFVHLLGNRFHRWYEPKILPPISWVFWKYLHNEQGHSRFTNGLREFFWTVMCGHGVGYGLHVANIWWKVSLFPTRGKARCMRCGSIHPYYRFERGQVCYLLYCKNCGTSMHEPAGK